ncbi:MAG: polyprenyl synthetase family protein [Nitrospirae bacterium]|nr:polyprenyl synthetase family protein [Nitrospirota bacterium]
MDIVQYLKYKKELVDNYLEAYVSSKKGRNGCPEELYEAMRYALMAGGKRIRPILALAGYEAVNGRSNNVMPVASSLELIHTYSLIHDDLPAMDDDDMRRNKPTTHIAFGEATAILAGDALLTEAFNIISNSNAEPGILINVIKEVTHACGPDGMVGGQTVDILMEGKKAEKNDIIYIHTHKTGVFIKAAVRVGAMMANATKDELAALTTYGDNVGLAFQIVDDILDITGTTEELGKTAGSDNVNAKNTYPSIFGIEESRKIAEALISDAVKALEGFDEKADPLREIAKYIISRRN